jgi:hypothetical protein
MLILSQCHIFEPYRINIFVAGSNKLTTLNTVWVVHGPWRSCHAIVNLSFSADNHNMYVTLV